MLAGGCGLNSDLDPHRFVFDRMDIGKSLQEQGSVTQMLAFLLFME